jgi:hypothetical protein
MGLLAIASVCRRRKREDATAPLAVLQQPFRAFAGWFIRIECDGAARP